MNHHRPNMNGKDKEGIAFGEAVLISSPPSRSQIDVHVESGFGGWADEKIKIAREAAPNLGRKKSHTQHLTKSHYSRYEPSAVILHAVVCTGGTEKSATLPRPIFVNKFIRSNSVMPLWRIRGDDYITFASEYLAFIVSS